MTTLKLSEDQQWAIAPIIYAMKEGESLIAQVYIDGMRLKVLDVETTKRTALAIGTAAPLFGRKSAFECESPMSSEAEL